MLIINPNLSLTSTLSVRRRGVPYFTESFPSATRLEVIDVITKLMTPEQSGISIENMSESAKAKLVELGFLVDPNDVSQVVSFDATLEPSLLDLIPATAISRAPTKSMLDQYRLSPALKLQLKRKRPLPMTVLPPANCFPRHLPIAWAEDNATRMHWPYFLDQNSHELIDRIANLGSQAIRELNDEQLLLLTSSGILTTETGRARQQQKWDELVTVGRTSIATERYTVVRELLPPLYIAILRKYYRLLFENGYMSLDREQVKNMRHSLHNEEVAFFIHRQSGALIRQLTGELLIPSYSFISAYLPEANLPKHVDRPQCAWNGSLLIDSHPEVNRHNSWPIYLEVNDKPNEVRLELGDAVFYQGTELQHWRDQLPPEHSQTLMLLHYVPMEFQGTLS